MDSEKNAHMRELLENGRPVTDEGPFYHHAWWESYKGSVKGKLGGGVLGSAIGAVTGALAVGGITLATTAFPPSALLIVGGFSAAGLLYGVHEFSEVGKVTGAVAASQKTAEKRMKAYEDSKFDEIKEEISELKSIVKGEQAPEKTAEAKTAALKAEQDNYRTDHFEEGKGEKGLEKLVFWKVALVGLAIGVATGALLAFGGMGTHILEALGSAAEAMGATGIGQAATEASKHGVANYAASMTALGAVGASFGINRDIFRHTFDNTDLWFRGFVSHKHSEKVLLQEPQKEQTVEKPSEKVVYTNHINYPESETHHRDKYMAGQQALLDMDHTKMMPH